MNFSAVRRLAWLGISIVLAQACASGGGAAPAAPSRLAQPAREAPEPTTEAAPEDAGRDAARQVEAMDAEIRAIYLELAPVFARAEELGNIGRPGEADALFVEALASREGAAAPLMLGNILFEASPDRSFAFHARARELAPGHPAVELEWAMQLHRRDRCEEALPAYDAAARAWPEGSAHFGLVAHCLIVVGRADDAIAAFAKVDHRRQHVQLEQLFEVLYGLPNALRVRADLRELARSGETTAWTALLVHDLRFRPDWWQAPEPHAEFAQRDLEEARGDLGAGSREYQDLEVLTRYRLGSTSAADVAAYARRHHRRTLPPSFDIALELLKALLETFSADELLFRYGAGLEARANARDDAALELLTALYEAAENRDALAELDRRGCEDRHIATFCASDLIHRLPTLASDDATLARALEWFPADPRFATVNLMLALIERSQSTEAALVRYLTVRPRHLIQSYGWKFGFLALGALRRDGAIPEPLRDMLLRYLRMDLELD